MDDQTTVIDDTDLRQHRDRIAAELAALNAALNAAEHPHDASDAAPASNATQATLGAATAVSKRRMTRTSTGGYIRDLTGDTFGHWTVLSLVGTGPRHGSVRSSWLCRCRCGTTREVLSTSLTGGHSQSCGCRTRHETTHGLTGSPEHTAWMRLRSRYRPHVVPAWDDFATFLRDVGPKPSPRHRITRYDIRRPYGPGNAGWLIPQTANRKDSPR